MDPQYKKPYLKIIQYIENHIICLFKVLVLSKRMLLFTSPIQTV